MDYTKFTSNTNKIVRVLTPGVLENFFRKLIEEKDKPFVQPVPKGFFNAWKGR